MEEGAKDASLLEGKSLQGPKMVPEDRTERALGPWIPASAGIQGPVRASGTPSVPLARPLFEAAKSELCTGMDYTVHLAALYRQMYVLRSSSKSDRERKLLEAAINGKTAELHKLLQEDSHILDRVMGKCEKERKDNPLHIAALYGHVDFIREMLGRKRELSRQLNSQGQSPLHLASARGHVEVVKVISDADHDACFVRDRDGMIPLHLAAIKGRVEVLEVLVNANKATVFLQTESGEPILHLCAKNNKSKALMKLVDLVEDDNFVNLRDQEDNTVLHLLTAKENSGVIWSLLNRKKKPDLEAVNMEGFTPFDVAVISTSGLGFVGWINHFILAYHGAKRTRVILPPKVAERWLGGHHGSWFFEAMLVLAILMVTVAFQAGLNPPGGVWQDTGYHNATLLSPNAPLELVHHFAGESVMSYVNRRSYTLFCRSNNLTLLTSMLVIQTLLIRCFFNSWIFNVIPIILTTISLMTMSATYTNSLSFISSDDTPVAKLELYYPSFILYSATVVHFCRMVSFGNIFCRMVSFGKIFCRMVSVGMSTISASCSPRSRI